MAEELQPVQTPSEHQATRLAALPELYKSKHERLCVELAMKMEEPEAIFGRYGYTIDEGIVLIESPAFGQLLDRIAKEVSESGLSFKAKARAQATELLAHSYEIATDPDAPTAVRADLIKWTAKVAGYEPKGDEKDGKVGGGFSLSITFAGQEPMKVVANEPVLIEGER